jgi:PQQ-dependent catabolism-associated CXXCW motif protein
MRPPVLKALLLGAILSSAAAAVAAAHEASEPNAPSTNQRAPGSPESTTPAEPLTSSSIPEPTGYWSGPVNSPVPATLTGGTVISSAHRLHALLSHKGTVLIDVSNAPKRPDNMAPGAPWLPLPHRAIPGTTWMPGVGAGEIPAALASLFRRELAAATHNNPTRRVIIYCHKACWLSWNAAKRAISYGYQHVYWYREGIEGWKAAGLRTAVVEPRGGPTS